MAKVVSLSRVRKSRARDDKRKTADTNAVKFGRDKGEQLRDKLNNDKANRHIDGHAADDAEKS